MQNGNGQRTSVHGGKGERGGASRLDEPARRHADGKGVHGKGKKQHHDESARGPAYVGTAAKRLDDFVTFHDPKFSARYADRKPALATLFEAYFDGGIDLRGDIEDFLDARRELTVNDFTAEQWKYFLGTFVPEVVRHSRATDERLVRSHYDRGDDFFAAFLGPSMVYTAAFFTNSSQSLDQAQEQTLDMVCQKLRLAPGERFLDIGCGWGALALHAARHYGVDATGVTLSKNQAAFGNRRIDEAGLAGKARILCTDYRDISAERWDRIASLEMVEHVGIKNLDAFFARVYERLTDQGSFLLQWTGLRRVARREDLVWGLFMAKYIFQGANTSLPCGVMVDRCEKANFEVQSVENLTPHYELTLQRWHDNWLANSSSTRAIYGERWFRIWNVFLAWSVLIARQGSAGCFQVVMNRNVEAFDRGERIGRPRLDSTLDLLGRRHDHGPGGRIIVNRDAGRTIA